MLVNDDAARARLNSPNNLMNRLSDLRNNGSRKNAMSLFVKPKQGVDVSVTKQIEKAKATFNPFSSSASPAEIPQVVKPAEIKPAIPTVTNKDEPQIDDLIENSENQVKLGLIHKDALNLLSSTLTKLTGEIDNIKPDKLPTVVAAAGKIIDQIRRERLDAVKGGRDKEVHYHFYTPQQKKMTDYQIIDVTPASQ